MTSAILITGYILNYKHLFYSVLHLYVTYFQRIFEHCVYDRPENRQCSLLNIDM